ncbi:MAG: hypothetical protein QOJ79_1986 [Actinomycetota bacterium]|jgi:2'-5' RNA ligase|nr:hypothetical protein [Actinomycetota bacterium]
MTAVLARLRGVRATALVVPVPEVAGLAMPAEMPPHVTVAFPFDLAAVGPARRSRLAALFQQSPRFAFELFRLERFADATYLAPRDPEPFAALVAAIAAAVPGYPLYGGRFPEYLPHVTVGPADGMDPARTSALTAVLPISGRADAVELWALRRRRGWVREDVFPLGT